MHPVASLMNHGIPVCLCSDDPAAFGNLGLSFDFYQVLVSSEQTGLITLGEIALDSLKVALFSPISSFLIADEGLFSIRRSKRRKRSGRSRCGRRGGRSFWRQLSRLGGICRPPLFEVGSSVCPLLRAGPVFEIVVAGSGIPNLNKKVSTRPVRLLLVGYSTMND